MVAEGVSDRSSEAEDVVGVKLVIVRDEVVVNLRADKEIAPRVITDSKAGVEKEMVAVQIGAAASGGEGARTYPVKEQCLNSGSRHDVAVGLGCQPMGINAVRIDQNRPVKLEVVIQALVVAEGAFNVDAKIFRVQVLEEEAGIGATSL